MVDPSGSMIQDSNAWIAQTSALPANKVPEMELSPAQLVQLMLVWITLPRLVLIDAINIMNSLILLLTAALLAEIGHTLMQGVRNV